MSRTRRIVIIVSTAVLAVILLGYFGQFAYLRTGSAKQLAASKIGEMLGGNVHVTELSGGIGSTDVHLEIDGRPGEKPLVSGKIRVDVSPLALAAGREPSVIHFDNPAINLHLDQNDNILDKLPHPKGGAGGGKIPDVVITGATIHFVQEGKPDFIASGIDIRITSAGSKITATGSWKDPLYGSWKLASELDSGTIAGSVQLTSEGQTHLTPQKLKAVPFVPKETWEAVEFDGMSTVDVRIGHSADGKWSWKVECDPTGTLLTVFPIDLIVTDTSAKVILEGARVTLKNVRGKTADGTLQTDALLDFEKKPSELQFQVIAKDFNVKKTPPQWELNKYLVDEGTLNGDAGITLQVADGKVKPLGSGKAKIVGTLAGDKRAYDIHLSSDGERLRFSGKPTKTSQRFKRPARDHFTTGVSAPGIGSAPDLAAMMRPPRSATTRVTSAPNSRICVE